MGKAERIKLQAGQRGTCQKGRPASHIWARMGHIIHRMPGSKPLTHTLQNQERSRCMCGVGRKKTKQASQRAHTSIASQPASHIWETRAHNIHHMAGSKPITHKLQNHDGSRCMCGVGRKKTKQASQIRGHILALPASNSHLSNKVKHHTPHGGQQAGHSQAAESR